MHPERLAKLAAEPLNDNKTHPKSTVEAGHGFAGMEYGYMAKQFPHLEPHHRRFIEAQHMFFTASAASTGHVNVTPRSSDMFRVLSDNAVMYLDRTGSGNETAAHLKADGRLTIMFCAVAGPPLIMRLYGKGRVIHRDSAEFSERLAKHFNNDAPLGARQMIHLDFDLVQTSCGYGVPLFEYQEERPQMDAWARAKGADGIEDYWRQKNQMSLDGLSTGLFDEPEASSR